MKRLSVLVIMFIIPNYRLINLCYFIKFVNNYKKLQRSSHAQLLLRVKSVKVVGMVNSDFPQAYCLDFPCQGEIFLINSPLFTFLQSGQYSRYSSVKDLWILSIRGSGTKRLPHFLHDSSSTDLISCLEKILKNCLRFISCLNSAASSGQEFTHDPQHMHW